MEENIVPHSFLITKKQRNKLKNHNAFLLWFTGLSGSGKSTIANAVEVALFKQGIHTYTLDGDNVRKGLNSNLSFSPEDRTENIRRIAEVANLMVDAGIVILAAFVSPYEKDRNDIKNIVGEDNYIEIFVNTSVEECERRDVKGLYAKARAGEIKNFTGISAPYEAPQNPAIEIDTTKTSVTEAVSVILNHIENSLKLNNE
ncbi:adenylyl-sulfate kinase [Patiriisocius hiemis]|uniref:Adenylyl-sulfate kinase n=1 Tax=Patiriisocius hiemis TaxID=3075604 RepID=A0ABU2YFS1_9FLAO|nr:adenylyl-sulfate kinase [Constantimarinum sp. W242]MDT0556635.1 adenylyl-sulfate kinase [Constantimarinum sp. W242]